MKVFSFLKRHILAVIGVILIILAIILKVIPGS